MDWPKVDNNSDLFLPSFFLHCFSSRLKQRKDYEQLFSVVNDVDNGNVDNIDNVNINNVVNVDNVDIDNVASVWRQHPSSLPLESPFFTSQCINFRAIFTKAVFARWVDKN